ncbi:MAG: RsmB/NOP family class I SAM-dependent RNA methyltransferase [Sporolactobacillus sp.]
MSLPEAFIEKMTHLLGAQEARAFFTSYTQPRTFGLRANLLKIAAERLPGVLPFTLRPIPFCSAGFYFNSDDHPGRHPLHQAGLYYIQEPTAMAVASVADAQPGERVLDLCAAPGGKSTQLAAAMGQRGLLVANEIYPKRAKILSENMERMGVRNALVTNETPERLADYFPGYFDKILVDAPCSGEGMFRKDPDAASYWSPEHVNNCAALQASILDHAYTMLRTGGTLIYSTCTFSPEENEKTIESFLSRYPDMDVQPIEKRNGLSAGRREWTVHEDARVSGAARLWPHRLQGEGHFICQLIKMGETRSVQPHKASSVKETELHDYREFEKNALRHSLNGCFHLSGNHLYLLPEDCPELGKLHSIRSGLHLGTFKKNRFEPNHALALALPADWFNSCYALDDSACDRYLHGETLSINAPLKGWTIVTYMGFPLGWCKASAGQLKNNYPKGLRRLGSSFPVTAEEDRSNAISKKR